MRSLAAVVVVALSCGYPATFRDCTIACTAESGCPSGLSCGAAGLCRVSGATATCGAVLDARGADVQVSDVSFTDGPVGSVDALRDVLLSEGSDAVVPGDSPVCSSDVTNAFRYNWFRVFSLANFSITGPFDITSIHLASQDSMGGSAVTVSVYAYTGTVGASTLDRTLLVDPPATTTTSFPNGGQLESPVPISAHIDAGSSFVVEIDTTDDLPVFRFHVGANTEPQAEPSYTWRSCLGGEPTMIPSSGSDSYVISVEGTY